MAAINSSQRLTLNRDALFHVLVGGDGRVVRAANARSAERVVLAVQSEGGRELAACGVHSLAHAQAVFILLLYADPELRHEVLEGTALSVPTRPMCEHKAARLFENLYAHVIRDWLKTELNEPIDLVNRFKEEYLAS